MDVKCVRVFKKSYRYKFIVVPLKIFGQLRHVMMKIRAIKNHKQNKTFRVYGNRAKNYQISNWQQIVTSTRG